MALTTIKPPVAPVDRLSQLRRQMDLAQVPVASPTSNLTTSRPPPMPTAKPAPIPTPIPAVKPPVQVKPAPAVNPKTLVPATGPTYNATYAQPAPAPAPAPVTTLPVPPVPDPAVGQQTSMSTAGPDAGPQGTPTMDPNFGQLPGGTNAQVAQPGTLAVGTGGPVNPATGQGLQVDQRTPREIAIDDARAAHQGDPTNGGQWDPHQGFDDASQGSLDRQEEYFIRNIINGAGNTNTTDEEKLINDTMQRMMGVDLTNSRARAGAAGYAASGGQIAAEGGIRRDAALGTTRQILDARRKAEQQAIDNGFKGIEADTGLKGAGRDAEMFDLIMGMLGQDDTTDPTTEAPATGSGSGSGSGSGGALRENADVNNTTLHPIEAGQTTGQLTTGEKSGAQLMGAPPRGSVYADSDGHYNYYTSPDGNTVFRVLVGGTANSKDDLHAAIDAQNGGG